MSAILLTAVTFAVYAPVTGYGFVNLDDRFFTMGRIGDGLTAANLKWAFSEFHYGFYYPLTLISHMLDIQLFHDRAGGHHLTSLLIHLANTLLLLTLLHRATKAPWRSFFVAALFALHPLHVESVAWVAERKDVLSTFFELLAFHAYLRYTEKRSVGRYLAVFMGFVFALLSKSMVITFPFLLILLDYWPLGRLDFTRVPGEPARGTWRTLRNLVLEKVPLFALIPVTAWLTLLAQMKEHALSAAARLPLDQRLANAILSYGRYILNMVAPYGLVAYVPHPQGNYSVPLVILAALFLAACTLAVMILGRRFRYLPMGWFWYLGSLIPVIGLVQTGLHASADRFTYVPLTGLFIILSWGACDALKIFLPVKRIQVRGIAVVLILALAVPARFQVAAWSSDEVLYGRILARYPQCALAHNNLGMALEKADRLPEAREHYEQAARIDPGFPDARISLANILAGEGKVDEAMDQCRQVLRFNPGNPKALNNLGVMLSGSDRIPEALECFQKAVENDPDFAEGHNNLALLLDRMNRPSEALAHFSQALRIQPGSFKVLDNLGLALAKMHRLPEAIERFQQAVRINPDFADAHCHLGLALAQAHRFTEAREHLQQALRINPNDEEARAGLQDVQKALGLTP